jgi:hypothetical protein
MPTGDGHWDEDLSWCYHWSHPGHTQMIPDEYAVNQRNGEGPSSKIIQAKSFLGNQRNSSFFQKRQRVENAESYYDAGALVVLVVWKMPCAPRGKLNGKAYRIYPIWPCGPCGGSWEPYSKRGFVHLFSILCALWTDVLGSGSQVLETERQAEVMHARRQLGRCSAIFFRSDPDQMRSWCVLFTS